MGDNFIPPVLISFNDQINASIALKYKAERAEKEYQRALQREQIENQEKIIKLLEERKKTGKSEPMPDYLIPGIQVVFLAYPEFYCDMELLIEHKYIRVENNKIEWLKSKKSLSEYFGYQTKKNKNVEWDIIQKLFNVKDLKNSFSKNGSSYRNKYSEDYVDWLKIKGSTPQGV